MDYEQKYNEALEKAQKELKCCGDLNCDAARQIFRFFPELRESDDERIRKEILNVVKRFDENSTICGKNYDYNKWINWLEKQREQKYDVPKTPIKDSEAVTSRMKYIDENLKPIAEFIIGYANWDLRKDEWNHPVATVPLFRVLDALVQNGKQYSEEHNVVDNNTKPKFKVGDWIVHDMSDGRKVIRKIVETTNKSYILDGKSFNAFYFDDLENDYHLWTINDAKDGDVLACENGWTCIFKTLVNDENFSSYCFMDKTKWFCETGSECHTLNKEFMKAYNGEIKPATKEQRDFLFQKIHETGYTWDAKTKQLIKNNSYDYRK